MVREQCAERNWSFSIDGLGSVVGSWTRTAGYGSERGTASRGRSSADQDNPIGKEVHAIEVYPNPTESSLNVFIEGEYDGAIMFELKDHTGRVLLNQRIITGLNTIDVSELSSGMAYYVIDWHSLARAVWVESIARVVNARQRGERSLRPTIRVTGSYPDIRSITQDFSRLCKEIFKRDV